MKYTFNQYRNCLGSIFKIKLIKIHLNLYLIFELIRWINLNNAKRTGLVISFLDKKEKAECFSNWIESNRFGWIFLISIIYKLSINSLIKSLYFYYLIIFS